MAVDTDVLADRYEVGQLLGKGGMAQVFEARDRLLDRRVAIKVLHEQLASDAEFLARFRREARAAASLNHAGIVAVYDIGQDRGRPFIVMEFIEGRTLADLIRAEGALVPERAAAIVAEVGDALAAAHEHGLVHRDVKPGNVMITPDGRVKVMDFGIARAVEDSTQLTTTMGVIGTPRYMAPEQIEGRALDARCDVYALGVCLYECLTGIVPFDGTSAFTIAARHVSEPPRAPREVRPEIAPALEAVTLRALAKDPDDRYDGAAAMVDALGRARTAPRGGATVVPAPVPVGHRRAGRIAAAVVLLLILALGALALVRNRDRATSGEDQASEAATVSVPRVAGLTVEQARTVLLGAGLVVSERQVTGADVPAGLAVGTEPSEGTVLEPGSGVVLLVSRGPESRSGRAAQGAGPAQGGGESASPSAPPAASDAPSTAPTPEPQPSAQPQPSGGATPEPSPAPDVSPPTSPPPGSEAAGERGPSNR